MEKILAWYVNDFFLMLQFKTGLPLSTYFSAVKLRWLLDNVEEIRLAVKEGRALFGTIDSWLIWVCICEFISTLFTMNFRIMQISVPTDDTMMSIEATREIPLEFLAR